MTQNITEALKYFGFKFNDKTNTYTLAMPIILKNIDEFLQIFCYEVGGNVYLSDNGNLINSFDLPNVNFVKALDTIEEDYGKFCHVVKGRLIKELTEVDCNRFPYTLSKFIRTILDIESFLTTL